MSDDGQARINARNASLLLESCYADTQDYRRCSTSALRAQAKQLETEFPPIGARSHGVEVRRLKPGGYEIVSHSRSGASFSLVRTGTGEPTRRCTPPEPGESCTWEPGG